MTPDLHAAATTLAADLATLHRAGRIARLYREGMRVNVGNVPRRWGPEDDAWVAAGVAHGAAYHAAWSRADLTDDLTVQGVLLLAREALGEPGLVVAPYRLLRYGLGWSAYAQVERHGLVKVCEFGSGPTEALAACAAIRAAAAGVGT